MSTPFRFDRGGDFRFRRSPDYQRNQPGAMEGQVIAKHYYVGHPPFTASQCHGTPGNPIEDSLSADSEIGDPFINFVSTWLDTDIGTPVSELSANADMNNVSVRYLTWHLQASGGYNHSMTCGKHREVGGSFANAGVIVRETFSSIRKTGPMAEQMDTFDFGLNDNGILLNENTTPYAGQGGDFYGPDTCASRAAFGTTSWPPDGYIATRIDREAYVISNAAYYKATYYAEGDSEHPELGEISASLEFYLTLKDGWSLDDPYNSIHQELDWLLAQVNLNNPAQQYAIEGDTTRALDPLGEQIVVTHEGPFPPEGETLYPVRVVFTSTVKPWNWAANGPCAVAQNLNDVINFIGETGVDPETLPGDIHLGDYWAMMKSVVLLPAGDYDKTIKRYWPPAPDSAAYDWPFNTPSGDPMGEPMSSALTTITGVGAKVYFSRGGWITITKLEASESS